MYEAYQDFDDQKPEGVHEEGGLRRVSDFLPVCLQDFLYSRESELWEGEITTAVQTGHGIAGVNDTGKNTGPVQAADPFAACILFCERAIHSFVSERII